MLLCLRCGNNNATLHDDEIAFQLRISDEEWQVTKQMFTSRNMLSEDNKIVNWDKRQFSSDSSTERSRKHREQKKSGATTMQRCRNALKRTETHGNAPEAESDTEYKNKNTVGSEAEPNRECDFKPLKSHFDFKAVKSLED